MDDCPVCLAELSGFTYSFPCRHIVHSSCGRELAANSVNPLCPVCRQSQYDGPPPLDADYVRARGSTAAQAILGRPECPSDVILWCCNRMPRGHDRRMHWSPQLINGLWIHAWVCYVCGRDIVQHEPLRQENRLLYNSVAIHCGFHGRCALLVDFSGARAEVNQYAVCLQSSYQSVDEQAEVHEEQCGRTLVGAVSLVPPDTALDTDSQALDPDSLVPAGQPHVAVPVDTIMIGDSSSEDDVGHVDMEDAIEIWATILVSESSYW